MKVSLSEKRMTELKVPRTSLISSASPVSARKKKTSKSTKAAELSEVAESIWHHLGAGDIDLRYATVGYAFDGRPIIDHDIFVSLLINYGFTIAGILEFIDDFNRVSAEDDTLPLVMVSAYATSIYRDVRSLGS